MESNWRWNVADMGCTGNTPFGLPEPRGGFMIARLLTGDYAICNVTPQIPARNLMFMELRGDGQPLNFGWFAVGPIHPPYRFPYGAAVEPD